jgi:murein endopeptidase
MSRARGGEIGTHRSHQSGRDVDIRLPRREGVSQWRPLTARRVDWHATWELVQAFEEVDAIVIFLDYDMQRRLYRTAKGAGASEDRLRELIQFPRGRGAVRGLVRHSDGHVRHMHVRFGCGPYETECVP